MKKNKNKKRGKSLNYFFACILVYICFFLVTISICNLLLTILQAHPYFHLLVAILIFIGDILFTDYFVNHYWKNKWILK